MAAIDDDSAEIRVMHERDGSVITDAMPYRAKDPHCGPTLG